jgi:RNA polymerase sigma-70 factor (ECF subfamily)
MPLVFGSLGTLVVWADRRISYGQQFPTVLGQFKLQQQKLQSARKFANDCIAAQSRLFCIAFGITGNRDDAEDMVQQAITIAIEKNQSFESEFKFIGWLSGIVRNCALNHRRKSIRRRTRATDPLHLTSVEGESTGESPIDQGTGEVLAMQRAFGDKVHAALEEISPKARSCLLLRTIEGLSYREISELMDVPEGTAMNMVHRSKKRLREILTPESDSDS